MLISVDTGSIRDSYDVSQDQIDSFIDIVTKEITASYAGYLEQQAKENLHKTRNTYIRNIKVLDEGRMKGAVLLDYSQNPLVRMIEEGASAFDMKIGFEHSNKAHTKTNGGWYLTIPFREASPEALAESDVFSGSILPKEVYDVIQKKEDDIPTSTGFKTKGLIPTEIPEQYRAPKTRAAVTSIVTSQKFEEYKHKTSIYTGVSKMTDKVTGQSSYQSFRRVSDKSDAVSWIFPGLEAKNLTQKAMSDLEAHFAQEFHVATELAIKRMGL